jgi:hypothetical protein
MWSSRGGRYRRTGTASGRPPGEHWTTEPSPTAAALSRLDRAESALYADLISNAYAPSVRLEQERIRFSAVEKAVASLMEPAA